MINISNLDKLSTDDIRKLREACDKLLTDRYLQKAGEIHSRIQSINQGKKESCFTEEDLVYAAKERCKCGYGMAYPTDIGHLGFWKCSALLLGKASIDIEHTSDLPFVVYEIKSEKQPSAHGATTRIPL